MDLGWLQLFFDACNDRCKVDFVAFHWYSSASNIDDLQQHVQNVIQTAAANGVDRVWLTEFGAIGTDAEVEQFLSQAMAFFATQGAVERYAYFVATEGILLNSDGALSSLGRYVGTD